MGLTERAQGRTHGSEGGASYAWGVGYRVQRERAQRVKCTWRFKGFVCLKCTQVSEGTQRISVQSGGGQNTYWALFDKGYSGHGNKGDSGRGQWAEVTKGRAG